MANIFGSGLSGLGYLSSILGTLDQFRHFKLLIGGWFDYETSIDMLRINRCQLANRSGHLRHYVRTRPIGKQIWYCIRESFCHNRRINRVNHNHWILTRCGWGFKKCHKPACPCGYGIRTRKGMAWRQRTQPCPGRIAGAFHCPARSKPSTQTGDLAAGGCNQSR